MADLPGTQKEYTRIVTLENGAKLKLLSKRELREAIFEPRDRPYVLNVEDSLANYQVIH